MNELTALKSFRAERDAEPPGAREAVWFALEARIEAAAAESRAFGEAVAGSTGIAGTGEARPRGARPGLFARRRRLLAFAGAALLAAIVAGTLVLKSGPTAQPASAAEILHQAADAAASSPAAPSSIPGPGQYYFRKEERLNVAGWISPVPGPAANTGTAVTGGVMHYPNSYNALVPTQLEWWTGDDGGGRYREVLGSLDFWSKNEEARWKAAGSPLPPPFNPEYRRRYPDAYRNALEANSQVVDLKNKGYGNTFHFPDTSKLSTDPQTLRHEVETNAIEVGGFNLMYAKETRLDAAQTKEELINVLFEGEPTPQLQEAIFNALAELPGIKVVGATDSLGRQGDAIKFAARDGIRSEYLFDPDTSDLLATRSVLVDPAASVSFKELPAGTTVSERDYIEAGVVDSIHDTPGGAKAEGS